MQEWNVLRAVVPVALGVTAAAGRRAATAASAPTSAPISTTAATAVRYVELASAAQVGAASATATVMMATAVPRTLVSAADASTILATSTTTGTVEAGVATKTAATAETAPTATVTIRTTKLIQARPSPVRPGFDDDCDGSTNDLNASGCTTYYRDFDGDSYGVDSDTECRCDRVGDYTATRGGDCNDSNAAINPSRPDNCNGVDDDCNGSTADGSADCSGGAAYCCGSPRACRSCCDDGQCAGSENLCIGYSLRLCIWVDELRGHLQLQYRWRADLLRHHLLRRFLL